MLRVHMRTRPRFGFLIYYSDSSIFASIVGLFTPYQNLVDESEKYNLGRAKTLDPCFIYFPYLM